MCNGDVLASGAPFVDELSWLIPLAMTVMTAATPLVFAATGELVTEKAGVLNLGLEGMMAIGALGAFAGANISGSVTVGLICGALAGVFMALLFSLLTLSLLANQVATGLALTIFGLGLSALLGSGFVGVALAPFPRLDLGPLSELPGVGPVLFGQDYLVYLSFILLGGTAWFLKKTRAGLILRAVGESHDAAHALGHSVIQTRYAAALFGGATSGLGGAYLSLAYTPMWADNLIAGRGWIALALVVFSTWRPSRLLAGAYLFGLIAVAQLHVQSAGISIPSQILSMLPYLATIVVLVLISRDETRIRLNAPACLGKAFHPHQ